jgi:hypothetical protein
MRGPRHVRPALAAVATVAIAIAGCTSDPSPLPSAAPPAVVEPGPLLDPPSTMPFPGTPWALDGRPVENDVIQLIAGPEHCGWQDVLFLTMGWPLGRPAVTSDLARQYVRDPSSTVANATGGPFQPSVPLPADAFFTGYRYGADELWVSTATVDDIIYYVRDGHVEGWPRAPEIIGCM